MRVFAGKHPTCRGKAATASRFCSSRQTLAIIEHRSLDRILFLKRVLVMRSGKAIAAIASVAAVVCSIFVFSWVGLALLGF
jgi:hypothetical protein